MNSSNVNWAVAQHLKPIDFTILAKLSAVADDDGYVDTDGQGLYRFIIEITGLSQMTIYNSLNRLEILGYVDIERNTSSYGQKLPNEIFINFTHLPVTGELEDAN